MPSDWPGQEVIRPYGKGDEGLKVGIIVTIVLVSSVVGIMLGFLVVRGIRRHRAGKDEVDELDGMPSFRRAGQNAPKDPSEALNIEMDGSGFRESIMSSKKNGIGNFSFEVDSEMGTPKVSETSRYDDSLPPPPPPPPDENGKKNGFGSSARNSWGGQML
jgi:hypothetical protein